MSPSFLQPSAQNPFILDAFSLEAFVCSLCRYKRLILMQQKHNDCYCHEIIYKCTKSVTLEATQFYTHYLFFNGLSHAFPILSFSSGASEKQHCEGAGTGRKCKPIRNEPWNILFNHSIFCFNHTFSYLNLDPN